MPGPTISDIEPIAQLQELRSWQLAESEKETLRKRLENAEQFIEARWPAWNAEQQLDMTEAVAGQLRNLWAMEKTARAIGGMNVMINFPIGQISEVFMPYFGAIRHLPTAVNRLRAGALTRQSMSFATLTWPEWTNEQRQQVLRFLAAQCRLLDLSQILGPNFDVLIRWIPSKSALQAAADRPLHNSVEHIVRSLARISHRAALHHGTTKARWEARW
ncbi:hypothetical protein JCM11641_003263 [Rhodosporidiobolus odoratus]